MKKSTLVALSILGALAMPVMGLASGQLGVTDGFVGNTDNTTPDATLTVTGFAYTSDNGDGKYCSNWASDPILVKNEQSKDVYSGKDGARCGLTPYNMYAMQIHVKSSKTNKTFIACTGAYSNIKGGEYNSATVVWDGHNLTNTLDSGTTTKTIFRCAGENCTLDEAEQCTVSPGSA